VALAYFRPRSIDATRELTLKGGRILAGGQSLMPLVNRGDVRPEVLIDINRLEGLDHIALRGGQLEIGALVRLERVRTDPLVRAHAPLLAAALAWVANPGVRQRGTLVGNAVAAPPGAEAVAALVLQGASLVLAGASGDAPAEVSPGSVPDGAFATAVRLPLAVRGTRAGFFEVQRRFGHLGLVGAGVMTEPDGRWSVVLTNLTDAPLVASALAESVARGALDDASLRAALDIDLAGRIPREDLHATARYRREVAPEVVRRAVERLWTGVEGPVHGTSATASGAGAAAEPFAVNSSSSRGSESSATEFVDGPAIVALTVDGEPRTLTSDARTTLAESLDLRIGCAEGVCGACTVALDDKPVRACLILTPQADGCRVDTVKSLARLEGAADGADRLTPLQRHLRERQAFQCGWCLSGLLVGTACFLRGRERAEGSEIAMHLVGHLCRCLASAGVMDAIEDLLHERRGGEP